MGAPARPPKLAADELAWIRPTMRFLRFPSEMFEELSMQLGFNPACEMLLLALARFCEMLPSKRAPRWKQAYSLGIPWFQKSWSGLQELQDLYNVGIQTDTRAAVDEDDEDRGLSHSPSPSPAAAPAQAVRTVARLRPEPAAGRGSGGARAAARPQPVLERGKPTKRREPERAEPCRQVAQRRELPFVHYFEHRQLRQHNVRIVHSTVSNIKPHNSFTPSLAHCFAFSLPFSHRSPHFFHTLRCLSPRPNASSPRGRSTTCS